MNTDEPKSADENWQRKVVFERGRVEMEKKTIEHRNLNTVYALDYYYASEVHALLRAVAEEVMFLSCRNDCASAKWVPHNQDHAPCNCPRGALLARLDEEIGK